MKNRYILLVAAALALASCGGKSGNSSNNTSNESLDNTSSSIQGSSSYIPGEKQNVVPGLGGLPQIDDGIRHDPAGWTFDNFAELLENAYYNKENVKSYDYVKDVYLRSTSISAKHEVLRTHYEYQQDRNLGDVMVEEELTIESIQDKLSEVGYISNDEISTSMFLALSLNKPVLIEGPPGVGKTELAKSISKSLGRDFFRIQCYEGITFEQIVGEWNYQKQLLHLEAFKGSKNEESSIFEEDFFIRRPLLSAFSNENPSLLLIDEIDKADEEVESFLLQALGEQEITVNDLGTFPILNDLIVILTSNSQRVLLDETKDRCLFLYISYPSVDREIAIVKARLPEAEDGLVRKIVNLIHRIRTFNLTKKPSVRASIDWTNSVMKLDKDYKNVDSALEKSLGVAIKTEADKAKVQKEIFKK